MYMRKIVIKNEKKRRKGGNWFLLHKSSATGMEFTAC